MHSSPLEDTLRLFGKERFRPMQRELMECALAGRSCIGILPTGSGKSLCSVSYTHLRAHETRHELVCRLLLEKKKTKAGNAHVLYAKVAKTQ